MISWTQITPDHADIAELRFKSADLPAIFLSFSRISQILRDFPGPPIRKIALADPARAELRFKSAISRIRALATRRDVSCGSNPPIRASFVRKCRRFGGNPPNLPQRAPSCGSKVQICPPFSPHFPGFRRFCEIFLDHPSGKSEPGTPAGQTCA